MVCNILIDDRPGSDKCIAANGHPANDRGIRTYCGSYCYPIKRCDLSTDIYRGLLDLRPALLLVGLDGCNGLAPGDMDLLHRQQTYTGSEKGVPLFYDVD